MDTVMLLSHISLQPQYVIQIIVDTDDHLEWDDNSKCDF